MCGTNLKKAQALGKERVSLKQVVDTIKNLEQGLEDVEGLLELAVEAEDEETFNEAVAELDELEQQLAKLEFRRMFSGEHDACDCYVDLQAGSGGTEAQDWTEMLLRMYLRWAESKGFKTELMEVSDGDVAGLKSATIRVSGEYAFGWLRTETGIHRLVRKSPFDSNNRRHTSFAAAFVYPEIRMMILILKSIQLIYVLMFTEHPVRVVSMSIKPKVRCVLLTCQVGLSCNVKTIVLNTKIKIKP